MFHLFVVLITLALLYAVELTSFYRIIFRTDMLLNSSRGDVRLTSKPNPIKTASKGSFHYKSVFTSVQSSQHLVSLFLYFSLQVRSHESFHRFEYLCWSFLGGEFWIINVFSIYLTIFILWTWRIMFFYHINLKMLTSFSLRGKFWLCSLLEKYRKNNKYY